MWTVFTVYAILNGLRFRESSCIATDLSIKHEQRKATISQSVTLSCLPADEPLSFSVQWWYRRSRGSEPTEIYVDGELVDGNSKRFKLDNNSYSLTIISAALSDSGIYTCVNDGGRHITQLHVKEITETTTDNHTTVSSTEFTQANTSTTQENVPVLTTAVHTKALFYVVLGSVVGFDVLLLVVVITVSFHLRKRRSNASLSVTGDAKPQLNGLVDKAAQNGQSGEKTREFDGCRVVAARPESDSVKSTDEELYVLH